MGDGRRPLAGFIGEQAAIDATVEGVGECRAKKAPSGRRSIERTLENRRKRRADVLKVSDGHRQRAHCIEQSHERHNGRRDQGDAADAADDDQAQQGRERQA